MAALDDLLDAIQDDVTVCAYLQCRHALVALGAEIVRRREAGAPLAAAYRAIRDDQAGDATLNGVAHALRLPPGPVNTDAGANALALLVEAVEGAEAAGADYASWPALSPFRSYRPPLPAWDHVAARIFDLEMRFALSAPPGDLLVAQVPEEARREEETGRRRDRDQSLILTAVSGTGTGRAHGSLVHRYTDDGPSPEVRLL